MKDLQGFFTEHHTGKRCNPRSETRQGRKCAILKVGSGSEAPRENLLKIVCKWRCLRSENSPKTLVLYWRLWILRISPYNGDFKIHTCTESLSFLMNLPCIGDFEGLRNFSLYWRLLFFANFPPITRLWVFRIWSFTGRLFLLVFPFTAFFGFRNSHNYENLFHSNGHFVFLRVFPYTEDLNCFYLISLGI